MQIVTVNVPRIYLDAIKKLLDNGYYPSRSETIRVALRFFLKKELELVNKLLSPDQGIEKNPTTPIITKVNMRSVPWVQNNKR